MTINGYCVDGTCTLVDVIIVDPTHANFVLRAASSCRMDVIIAIQTKIVSLQLTP
jgi:hypothetical protein